MSEVDFSVEKAILDSLIPEKISGTRETAYGSELIYYGKETPEGLPERYGKIVIYPIGYEGRRWWMADLRQASFGNQGWEDVGVTYHTFENLVKEIRSDDFRRANNLPPLEDMRATTTEETEEERDTEGS